VVDLVRALRLREDRQQLTVRGALALARVTATAGVRPTLDDPLFRCCCRDILHATDEELRHAHGLEGRPSEAPGEVVPGVRRRRARGGQA
jgi:hypothetical protein